jgi:hypothetical protein
MQSSYIADSYTLESSCGPWPESEIGFHKLADEIVKNIMASALEPGDILHATTKQTAFLMYFLQSRPDMFIQICPNARGTGVVLLQTVLLTLDQNVYVANDCA